MQQYPTFNNPREQNVPASIGGLPPSQDYERPAVGGVPAVNPGFADVGGSNNDFDQDGDSIMQDQA